MSRQSLPLQQLCDTAVRAAIEAGQFIQRTDRGALRQEFKNAGGSAASQLVTQVDLDSEKIIRNCLQSVAKHEDIVFVGEESSENTAEVMSERISKPYYWCVDPLDGTLPFVEGRAGYAVSIALVEQSGIPLIGVVYHPEDATLIYAIKGQGAYRDQMPMSGAAFASKSLMVFADESFRGDKNHDNVLTTLKACAKDFELTDVELVYGSGAVKNACQVLDYAAACYIKLPKPEDGGGSIWDFAATACIASETRSWVSNIYGDALDLNRRDSNFMNHQGVLYASNERIARYLIGKL